LLHSANAIAAHPAGFLPLEVTNHAQATSGWLGSLIRLFSSPLWHTSGLRSLDSLPVWFWPSYARHLFGAPPFFQTTDQENQWSRHLLTHLDAVVRTLEANRGSSAAKTVAQIALTASARWPSVGSGNQQLHRAQALGRLRTLLAPRINAFQRTSVVDPASALRVAVIKDTHDAQSNVLGSTQFKTLLDSARVDLTCYAPEDLPSEVAAQVEALRTASFDAVIFACDVSAPDNPFSQLALHRVAPRQFATALSPRSSGLPEIDVFLADGTFDATAYSEQVARLPSALAFDFSSLDTVGETSETRTDLGLPADAHLLVATVHPAHTTVATRERWKHLLEQDPCVRLILIAAVADTALPMLLAECERQFGNRVILAGDTPLQPDALTALLRVCDGYIVGTSPEDHYNRQLAQHLGLTVANVPPRIDCLAFADALTAVLEIACRTPDQPLIAPAIPHDLTTRHHQGKDLLAFGRADRAVVYLLAAIEDPHADAAVWHDLALALHANNQPADAIQALETSVRLDANRLDAWLLLADWATDFGHTELVNEITEVVSELAPADPRVVALHSSRLA
ncbi:MAG: hypothetical protein ABW223_06175, partial [Rariglobus sp.]